MIELPRPEPAALELSNALASIISARIDAQGPLTFDRFWQLAQYHPELGYYHNGLEKFGPGGDFVTAPELGQVFGRCLATWAAGTLERLQRADALVLEAGAGTGALAATLLAALQAAGRLPERYAILEVSAALRERQRRTLEAAVPDLLNRVRWLDQPPEQPWHGLLIGNEVVDALPARRYRCRDGQWYEQCVSHNESELDWVTRPEPERLPELRQYEYSDAAVIDLQRMLPGWIRTLTGTLERGAVWLADYGYVAREYFHPQRADGTAIAHYRQLAHDDLLALPGLQDLSVNVNFSQLAEALEQAGLQVCGFTSQAQFLIENGLQVQIEAAQDLPERERWRLMQEVKQLTLPAEMGERFSVLMAARGLDLAPPAADQRGRL